MGVTDIALDPRNPDWVYAVTWQRHRNVAAYMGGGPGTGIHRSTDGGENWEELKKGAGHHVGSANPGEKSNCIISAHNDVFGEIFKDIQHLESGDKVTVYAGDMPYDYVVRAKRVVEPSEVSVMDPTPDPILTLITCHPYMIDTQRMIVIAELVGSEGDS